MVTSCVRQYHGVPTLYINEKPVSSPVYLTYLPERNDYAAMAETGCHLYTVTLYFGGQTINEVTQIHPFAPGIFDEKGKADFSVPDQEIRRILAADPKAMIFPRINTALPAWWEDEHPDELNDEGFAGGRRRPCFASRIWQEAVGEGLRLLAEHFEQSEFCQHIFGYQIGGGNTEEWFSFDQKGSVGLRARQQWAAEGGDPADEDGFCAFLSRTVADCIAWLSGQMKQYTHHRLVIGSFYGYTFETPWRESCHGALARLLQCPELDFLCSPSSYAQSRLAGADHACMTVLESVLEHGKLYFSELDDCTHLSLPLAQSRENSCEPGTYIGGRWKGPADAEEARGILRADFCRQLVHGNSFWWFDMWGGWYCDEGILADFGCETQILQQALQDERRGTNARVAVLVDEAYLCRSKSAAQGSAAYQFRIPLGWAGAPYASYDVSDFETVYRRYDAFLLVEPLPTEGMQQVRRRLQQEGLPFLVVDADTPMEPETFRQFFKKSGIWVYCDTNDVIGANDRWLYIHAAEAGEKRIRLPHRMHIVPCFGDGEAFTGEEIVLSLPKCATRLFRVEEVLSM